MAEHSYHDRTGEDPEQGSAIQVRARRGEVALELGVMRNFGSIATHAWAALSPAEARELADDLRRAAGEAEGSRRG
ncbi:hypothetical protein [Methylobacterium aquaticum]|uniref:hypothetical protein n=1 Tax=Methylobacterium aquaticum TaxID=270351 RepID=UPI0019328804|nr:hypothetical protein [Methylobacterium aquaticum]QRE77354.1 hypothetical protein F1D61_30940 [Methylobacterium aquaticum]